MLRAMKQHRNIVEAQAAIEQHDGPARTFELAVADSLIDDLGINMGILTDAVLARGWVPGGYEEAPGGRIYRYKEE